MKRADREEFLEKTTLGFVPAGTANGLVASMMDAQGETGDEVLTAAFMIAKGRRSMMDLNELRLEYFQQAEEERQIIYMFLSLTWAFVSDVDINSESLRCLGAARFEVYGLYRLLNIRHYGGELTFTGA